MRAVIILLLSISTVAIPATAQIPERLEGRLSAIFDRNEYTPQSFGPAEWLDGGRAYAVVGRDGGLERHETASGAVVTLASAAELKLAGDIGSFTFSSDGSKVLLFTNTRKVWRLNTRGDYWLLDLKSRLLRQIGKDAPTSSLMFAKLSPDATRIAYVHTANLYVEDVATGRSTALTADGGAVIINGTSDWVNEEELFLRDGFKWSPDGTRIVYWQFDTSNVGRFTLINNTDTTYPQLKEYAYPKAGTTNSSVRLGVVYATGGPTVWMKAPGDPREHYIPRVDWVDAATLAFLRTARRQNVGGLYLADATTGHVRTVHEETTATWLDAIDPLAMDASRAAFGIKGSEFTWISDKDGWRHVYAISQQTRRERLLTRFDGDALTITAVDQARDLLYFVASPENATQRYLYSGDISSGAVARVTPSHLSGTHTYQISPDGRWAFDTYSRHDAPPRTDLVTLPDHTLVRTLVANDDLGRRIASLVQQPAEFVHVSIDPAVTLDGVVIKPTQFNESRRYPALVYVYSEPWSTTVNDRWLSTRNLLHRAIADEGYVVLAFDNRGTPAPKGAAWRKVVYGSIGDLAVNEQAAAIQQFVAQHRYVDPQRIAIYGASGGGSATLHAMFRFPQVYKVGIAIAPGPDQRLYDTIYQERYMGLPQENPDGYFRGSPINFAEGLRGPLLLIHGTGDDNVHVQNTERLVNRLVELGKPFDLMLYPNRTHALNEGKGTTSHMWRTMVRYLFGHVPPQHSM